MFFFSQGLTSQGLWEEGDEVASLHNEPWITDETGQISSFRLPNGDEASAEDLDQDAQRWARAFARDARSCHSQNHDHDCTDTCVKYAAKQGKAASARDQPSEGDAAKAKVSSWTVPPCRFFFYTILSFIVHEGPREIVRRILRRGKALVSQAYIAMTNEHNEHGSFVPERRHPFRSSSSDVHQVVFRCNGDVQFKDRTVPADIISETAVAESCTSEQNGRARLFFGARSLSPLKKAVVHCYEVALKASSVADYYMTKYQSKAQQVLSAAMGPITAGLRRFEAEAQARAEDQEATPQETTLASLARAKLRRMVFSANKSHWCSNKSPNGFTKSDIMGGGLFWSRVERTLGALWAHYERTLASLWAYFGRTLGVFCVPDL